MKINALKIIFLAAVFILGSVVYAQSYYSNGNPLDTPVGRLITAEAAVNTLGYTDVKPNQMPTVEVGGGNIVYTTDSEYGFSGLVRVADRLNVTPGELVTNESYYITNEGNADDEYDIKSLFTYNGAAGWTVEVYSVTDAAVVSTLTPDVVDTYVATVEDNANLEFYYRVHVSPIAANAPNLSYIEISTTVETDSDPAGTQYTGGNALKYGGYDIRTIGVSDAGLINKVSAPSMTLTRESIVDSPVGYIANAGAGHEHDPVPGAVITYTMYYQNAGSATAESVIIIDKVTTIEAPSGADSAGGRLAHRNASGNRGQVVLTPPAETASGWTMSYTTEAVPTNTGYGGAGWVTISANPSPASGFYTPSNAQFSATWVKWEKEKVSSGEAGSLVWGVSIR